MSQDRRVLFDRDELARTISRMAHEIVEKWTSTGDLVLLGIPSRGVHLARRLAQRIQALRDAAPLVAALDITPYRDDRAHQPITTPAGLGLQLSVDDKIVVLVDDVIFTGRTVRAAMEAVVRLGQPQKILVAALVDRGARELPIRADIVGKNIQVDDRQRVNVLLKECDGTDQIVVSQWQARSG
jgi:pyrimidine operon attenuation protein / uracil phosphoribosyltransferase